MNEATAKAGLAAGVTLFGLTLAEISTIVTIVAGLAATVASVAAAYFYFKKGSQK